MATITDPQVNNWWDTECRTIAEDIEKLLIKIRSAKTRYTEEISAKLAAYAGADLLDARADEGIPISSKDGMSTWASNVIAVLTAIEGTAGREEVLTFPAVRPPV